MAEYVADYTDFYSDRSMGREKHGDGFVEGLELIGKAVLGFGEPPRPLNSACTKNGESNGKEKAENEMETGFIWRCMVCNVGKFKYLRR